MMKILFDHPNPFLLAHGGFQIQIEQTKAALEGIGVAVEFLRWWDAAQQGHLIHFFGRPPADYIRFAHGKGLKVIIAELLTGLGSRSGKARLAQKVTMRAATCLLPRSFTSRLAWESYRLADACVALTEWEARLMREMFDAPGHQVHVIPNGVEEVFLRAPKTQRGPWMVCTATITERKRVLELAQAAVLAETPLWVLGRPYADDDPYARSFFHLAKANSRLIRYEGAIGDRARLATIYSEARGFVLLSTMETLSLSALEAAACGCPLMLSDLPWARSAFDSDANYCPVTSPPKTAVHLRRFYDAAPQMPSPRKPLSWSTVAKRFKSLYERVLSTS
jgi:glycosyltransferase involved in cell wall biosynthesis